MAWGLVFYVIKIIWLELLTSFANDDPCSVARDRVIYLLFSTTSHLRVISFDITFSIENKLMIKLKPGSVT